MIKVRNLAALLALSSVAALPACSMFGGGDNSSQSSRSSYSSQGYAAAQPAPSYSSGQTMASTELTPDMIRSVQQTLSQDGSYRGRVDGVWGPQTQAAVRNYQQQHNMNATGQLDQETLAAMNLGNGQNNAQQQGNAQQPQQQPSQQYGSNYNSAPPPNSNQPRSSSSTR